MSRAVWLMIGWGIASGLCGFAGTAGVPTAFAQESGSAERPRPLPLPNFLPPPRAESGSAERPRRNPLPNFLPPPRAESGSSERPGPNIPLPFDPFPAESGSQERSEPILPDGPNSLEPGHPEQPGPSVTPPSPAGPQKTTPEAPPRQEEPIRVTAEAENSNLIPAAVIFVVGLFLVGWLLFRMGMFNPYAASLWPKRLELCIEVALRMDDFLTASREENFEKCQMSLDALNHLNGRRSILLSNQINAAVNEFIRHAVDAKVSKEDEDYQKNLNRQYEKVIEALRVGTRQEELSLAVLQSLTKAQGPHRRLRDDSTEDDK